MTDDQALKLYDRIAPLFYEPQFSRADTIRAIADLMKPEIPPSLVELSKEATPGNWFWDQLHASIKTDHNPTSREETRFGSDVRYQDILWPSNSMSYDSTSAAELLGACGVDTERQSEANQRLLVWAVNYVRKLIQEQQ
jgi:hypothetical protein